MILLCKSHSSISDNSLILISRILILIRAKTFFKEKKEVAKTFSEGKNVRTDIFLEEKNVGTSYKILGPIIFEGNNFCPHPIPYLLYH